MRLDLYQQVDILFSVLEELLKSPFNKQFDDKVKHVLRKHGLDVVEGEIIKTQRRVSAEAKENGYGESEDEKIRKSLLMWVQSNSYTNIAGIQINDVVDWLEKQGKRETDCHHNHQDANYPNGCVVLEDFNGGEGFYKVHLDYLNKKQVEEIEEMIRTWNKELKVPNENIKSCIGMCLTDVGEQRFKDYNTSLKDCLAWLEKQAVNYDCNEDERIKKWLIAQLKIKIGDNATLNNMIYKAIAWLEKQGTSYTKRDIDNAYVEGMAFAKDELEKQGEQKSAWSEEDERAFHHVLSVLEEYGEEHPSNSKFVCNWLKSLKQRCTWKPSEKQMEALEDEVRNNKTVFRKNILADLLEQLKKL